MYGDWSRIRFNPANQYTAVVKQQGRVDLDSDDLEQHAIDLRLRQNLNSDVIGQYGGPENDAGFAISIEFSAGSYQIMIGPGRYYVQGTMVENLQSVSYDDQLHLIDPANTASGLLQQLSQAGEGATLGFVLQVWQRLVTALDDPCLLEPALGQADTTVRLQTVWRVIGTINTPAPPEPSGGAANNPISQLSPCCQALYGQQAGNLHTGQMGASLAEAGSECGCQPIAAAGYQGLENQLYRVEIHQGGDLSSATFKWSRENGSVVAAVTSVGTNSPVITVSSLGPDANLGFQPGQWVELSDDTYLFGPTPNQAGIFYQIQSINPASLQVTLTSPVTSRLDSTRNARMRRWDQSGPSATASGIAVSTTPIPLENGILVSFSAGEFQPGDYWTIPARTANGQIDWPPCGGNNEYFQPANYMQIYQAPVACVGFRLDIFRRGQLIYFNPYVTRDCRLLFPPLTTVSASTTPPALHVSAISWANDDVMTVDTLLQQGLSITFDQPPTCPFGGGNFPVTLEPPVAADTSGTYDRVLNAMGAAGQTATGTDVFLRTKFALDPPQSITVTGNQVVWLPPLASQNAASDAWLWFTLNVLLNSAKPAGYGRMKIQLDGSAVYGAGSAGNVYLDGQAFGSTGTRASDGSPCVSLKLPSGDANMASDFEGWFYLAPSVLIESAVIQGTIQGATQPQTLSAVTIETSFLGAVGQIISGSSVSGSAVSNVEVIITLNYAPIADTVVTLSFSGTPMPGAGTVVTIPGTAAVPAGQISVTVPITFTGNPPTTTTTPYEVTLSALVATAFQSLGIIGGSPPTLSISVVQQSPPIG